MYKKSFLLFSLSLSFSLSAQTLYPQSVKVINGSKSEQSVSVLSKNDQKASQNSWGSYIELSASSANSVVDFTFSVPSKLSTCKEVRLEINRLGEPKSIEKWYINIKNANTQKFENLLVNTQADWTWSKQNRAVSNIANYIDNNSALTIESTCKECSVQDIDYMALSFSQCNDDVVKTPKDKNENVLLGNYNVQYTELNNLITENFSNIDIDMEDSQPSLFDSFAKNGKNAICYINVGAYEEWRSDAKDFDSSILLGNRNGWAGERWLDIRQIDKIRPLMMARLDRAKAKGCKAIHADNVDAFENDTGTKLSYKEQLNYNLMLAEITHQRGMLIGLKNDITQIPDLVDAYDFAISEECYEFGECEIFSEFAKRNKPVYIMEYKRGVFDKARDDATSKGYYLILKKLNLGAFVEEANQQ